MKSIISILLSFLVFACSENKRELTQNEKNYYQTQDSLIKYKSDILELSGEDTSMITDFIRLNYANYKKKYQLSEKEMDVMRRTLNVRCEEVKTFKAIQENISQPIQPYTKDSVRGDYSFNKKLKPANSAKEEDVETEVLMNAFEK